MQKGAFMAMHGQHREAQSYAKQWGRKMRSSNLNQEQADDGKTFVSNMNNVYQQMGAQDRKEAAIVGKSKQSKTGFFGFSKKGGPVARPMK